MEEIIRTLLLEGIDEGTIHRVLDIIEEEYEVVSERKGDPTVGEISQVAYSALGKRLDDFKNAKDPEKIKELQQRYFHADEMANLPMFSNKKYKKVLKAAEKVTGDRDSKALKLMSTGKDTERSMHAENIVNKK